jgi:hypothetical protein
MARPATERTPVNNTTLSAFPTNGTWLSRWNGVYTAAPASMDRIDVPVVVLPMPTTLTAAA